MYGSYQLIKRGKGGFRTHITTHQELELFTIEVVGKIVQEVGFDCLCRDVGGVCARGRKRNRMRRLEEGL